MKTLKKLNPNLFKKSRHTVIFSTKSYNLVFDYIYLCISNQIEPMRYNTVSNTLEVLIGSSPHLQKKKKVF